MAYSPLPTSHTAITNPHAHTDTILSHQSFPFINEILLPCNTLNTLSLDCHDDDSVYTRLLFNSSKQDYRARVDQLNIIPSMTFRHYDKPIGSTVPSTNIKKYSSAVE